jgi:hypothetical protein
MNDVAGRLKGSGREGVEGVSSSSLPAELERGGVGGSD